MEIFEKTYGPVKERSFRPAKAPKRPLSEDSPAAAAAVTLKKAGPEYLLVDGYNIIFAWENLKAQAKESLDAARKQLMDLLCNYQGYRKCQVILVFDAYKVKGGQGSVEQYHNIHVVYTKEAETADAYIEKVTYQLRHSGRVRVATSDGPEQLIILGHGALRVSASAFLEEMQDTLRLLGETLEKNNRPEKARAVKAALQKAQTKKEGSPC